jgi:hypothetical protein
LQFHIFSLNPKGYQGLLIDLEFPFLRSMHWKNQMHPAKEKTFYLLSLVFGEAFLWFHSFIISIDFETINKKTRLGSSLSFNFAGHRVLRTPGRQKDKPEKKQQKNFEIRREKNFYEKLTCFFFPLSLSASTSVLKLLCKVYYPFLI